MAKDQKKLTEEEPNAGAPAWMVTYGDLMTLLLCFFVLLLSFSSIEMAEFQKALGSLQGALGVLPKHESALIQFDPIIPQLSDFQKRRVQKVVSELRNIASRQGMKDQIAVEETKDGILIRIDSPVLYNSGTAELKKTSFPILLKIIEMINSWPNIIRIEGHTDNLPINTSKYPSNWELSTSRAISVLKYILNNSDIEPQRLSAVGYGEFRPILPNNSQENRAKNRRVEIYIEKDDAFQNYHDAIF